MSKLLHGIDYEDLPGRWQLSVTDCFCKDYPAEYASDYFNKYIKILDQRVHGTLNLIQKGTPFNPVELVVEGGYAAISNRNDVFQNIVRLIEEAQLDQLSKNRLIRAVEENERKCKNAWSAIR
ncbi:hypothetical protein N6L24_15445 [Cognatishimia sp. SS12]|uniref:hypothetical protein n=1 Tax=Cognatishimia sp. SS12 TaxID=2979465 RepID=UPI00232BA2D4|nr:hypothetical protein [Cognatishimia sp. SS12]MDC0739682.1 hypothetical protein [Cognatishimia sp. SS12]